jgi:nucleotide-binding universal stress UspA family protein
MPKDQAILVGVDGSESSLNALDWAVREADRRGLPVELVCAYTVPRFGSTSLDAAYLDVGTRALSEGAEAVLERAKARAGQPKAGIKGTVEVGDAVGVLVEKSKTAAMVVVGTRGKGGFAERLLGTVSTALPVHAHCPTVVVPSNWRVKEPEITEPVSDQAVEEDAAGAADPAEVTGKEAEQGAGGGAAGQGETAGQAAASGKDQKIVVGVDGSEASKVALSAAVETALAWESDLEAFASMPMAVGTSLFAWAPGNLDHSSVLAELEAEIGRMIEAELGQRDRSDLKVRHYAMDGTASALLVEFSDAADLIVVGSRGRGGFSGLLLGSTSQAVLHHAKCPVMVVPVRCKKADAADVDSAEPQNPCGPCQQ